jgi:hypothetical protein
VYGIPILAGGNFKHLHTAKFSFDTASRTAFVPVGGGSTTLNNSIRTAIFDIPSNSQLYPQFPSQQVTTTAISNTIYVRQLNDFRFNVFGTVGWTGCNIQNEPSSVNITSWQSPWNQNAPLGPDLTIICRTS